MISFDLPPDLADLRLRVRAFVDEHVIPNEKNILEEDRTKKRDTWGRRKQSARPATEWVTVRLEDLRVVSDQLWDAAHVSISSRR